MLGLAAGWLWPLAIAPRADGFDHEYAMFADVLAQHVKSPRVDYAALKANRSVLDRVVTQFASPAAQGERGWTSQQRMAFWINAYNAFTLRVIVDHYPIQSRWLTLQPRNSIRQIGGVWTDLTWPAAGRAVTLDDIEHRILRPEFKDPRIHFAINCASISCPPLAAQPYRARTLDDQLDDAARKYLASSEGLQMDGGTLRVSSLFKWFGEDFVADYTRLALGERDGKARAILGMIAKYGPPDAAQRAMTGGSAIRFLDYNWSLNDVTR